MENKENLEEPLGIIFPKISLPRWSNGSPERESDLSQVTGQVGPNVTPSFRLILTLKLS